MIAYVPYGSTIGGLQFRGSWKPYGYNLTPATNQYKPVNPIYKYGGMAAGFGLELYRNWGTIAAAGGAVRGALGAAVGGAMDLVHGAKQVVVITDHIAKDGSPKLVEHCTYPLTGIGCITRIYTSLAVIDISDKKFVLQEKLPSISLDELQSLTGAELHFEGAPDDLKAPKLGH